MRRKTAKTSKTEVKNYSVKLVMPHGSIIETSNQYTIDNYYKSRHSSIHPKHKSKNLYRNEHQ